MRTRLCWIANGEPLAKTRPTMEVTAIRHSNGKQEFGLSPDVYSPSAISVALSCFKVGAVCAQIQEHRLGAFRFSCATHLWIELRSAGSDADAAALPPSCAARAVRL